MIAVRDLVRLAASAIVVIGLLMLGYVGLVLTDALAYHAEYRLSIPSSVENVANVTNVASPANVETQPETVAPLVEGEAIGEIRIDRLGLREVIGQGDSAAVLRRGVAHLADTAWLGQTGNVALAGHRDTVFRALRDIQIGDRIDVTTAHRHAQYEVQSTSIVLPADLTVLDPSDENTLTLITCYPFGFIGAAPNRFVVRAREIR